MTLKQNFQPIVYLLLTVLCFSLAIILVIAVNNRAKPAQAASTAEQPDAFAEGIKAIRYDKTGHVASELTIPKLTHYANNNVSVFINPRVTLYYKNQQPWLITSDKGTAKKGFDNISLQGHVVLHQAAGQNNQDTIIMTDQLSIDTKSGVAFTNQPISLTQKAVNGTATTVHAIGARASQKTGIIQLLSQVRGQYVPTN